MGQDFAAMRGHGIALLWEDAAIKRLFEIEAEIVAEAKHFVWDAKHGATIAVADALSLHDMAVERLVAEGHPAPQVLGEGYNLLMTQGASDLWTTLTGGAITVYNNANANLGVGDSTTAAAVGQTDLQAVTNKLRVAMDATYPVLSTNQAQFRMTTGAAQFAWKEWALFNANAAGHMYNRAVPSGGLGDFTGVTLNKQLLVTLSLS